MARVAGKDDRVAVLLRDELRVRRRGGRRDEHQGRDDHAKSGDPPAGHGSINRCPRLLQLPVLFRRHRNDHRRPFFFCQGQSKSGEGFLIAEQADGAQGAAGEQGLRPDTTGGAHLPDRERAPVHRRDVLRSSKSGGRRRAERRRARAGRLPRPSPLVRGVRVLALDDADRVARLLRHSDPAVTLSVYAGLDDAGVKSLGAKLAVGLRR